MAAREGLLVVLSAPSGGGKTTLANELISRFENARRSISVTTRPPRKTEIQGQDYHFISDAEFEKLVKDNAFAEWAHVHGYRYGTTKASIKEGKERGEIVFLAIDVQGARNIKNAIPDALLIFVTPPDFDILETRLRKRGTENDQEIRKRLENARKEIAQAEAFDFQVLNDRLDRAALEIESIIRKRLGL
ncbi:MAG: guanylate kinase [Bdellovibrionales bacterium]|nr:guanylate kinase [Bdellovibrionales bacterium]